MIPRHLAATAALLLSSVTLTAQSSATGAIQAAATITPVVPTVGDVAPSFTAEWADEKGARPGRVSLGDLRGKVVVLAFYPRDRTAGCTAELTKFRDEYATLFGSDVVVLPVSVDSVASHTSWSAEMRFPFPLVSDPTLSIAESYGARIPGRGTSTRATFVIGRDGRIAWRELKFNALSEDAYAALAAAVARAR